MQRLQIDNEIELRPFVESDAGAIFQTVKENLEHLHTFLHWANKDYDLESAKGFIKQSQFAAEQKLNESFGIFYKGELVGSIGFVLFKWTNRRTEIGYWISKDYEGRGIITKSCRELIKYAFEKLEMNRIEIHCATENTRSRAVPEKLGFKLEGILRQSEWRHTRFFDMAIYAILKEEWKDS